MEKYSRAINLLLNSIGNEDALIGVFAMVTFFIWALACFAAIVIKMNKETWLKKSNTPFTKCMNDLLNFSDSVFVTLISLFPLLGMFGTVAGLLGLDLNSGDMNNIRDNFFLALTSTAWGIIFSIIFKLVNAITGTFFESQKEEAKKLLDEAREEKKIKYKGKED